MTFLLLLLLFTFAYRIYADCPNCTFPNASGGKCYFIPNDSENFTFAEMKCQEKNGDLASISNDFDNINLIENAQTILDSNVTYAWLGGRKDRKGTWIWSDGQFFSYTNWARGNPDNNTYDNCMVIHLSDGLWYSHNCYDILPYICDFSQTITTITNSPSTTITSTTTKPTTPTTMITNSPSTTITSTTTKPTTPTTMITNSPSTTITSTTIKSTAPTITTITNSPSTTTTLITSTAPTTTFIKNPKHSSYRNWIIFSCIGIVIFIFTTFMLIYCILRYREKKRRGLIDQMALEMQVQSTVTGKPTELKKLDNFWIEEKRLEIKYDEPLGTGFSSNVYVGKLFGTSALASLNTKTTQFRDCKVAIKIANEYGNNESKILETEIELMKKIGYHEHIVPLLGWSMKQNKPCLVLELCERNLLNYVRENHDVQFKHLISILWQIVQGMEYLVSKKLVHRDLAARNILLIESHTAKISDFGLCCSCDDATLSYQASLEKKLPMRWLSLEALLHRTFSEKSDVWSFGVLVHEVFSGGKVPYATMEADRILEFLKSGKRMECPENASDEIYEIMCSCWEEKVKTRLSFSELSTRFRTILFRETQDYGYICGEEQNPSTIKL